jgi:hypothetical protein
MTKGKANFAFMTNWILGSWRSRTRLGKRMVCLLACLAALVVQSAACAASAPPETPEQIEARKRRAELEARLADIRLTFDREDVRDCRSLGVISQDFVATTYRDYYTGYVRRFEFTAELALRDAALKAGADTALMPLPMPAWSRAAENFIFGLSKGTPPIECRIVGEIFDCRPPGGAEAK